MFLKILQVVRMIRLLTDNNAFYTLFLKIRNSEWVYSSFTVFQQIV